MTTPCCSCRRTIPKEPANLSQEDENSCLSCVAANILYIFGTDDAPDVGQVDIAVGRTNGDCTYHAIVARHLVESGLSLLSLDMFDTGRLYVEGLDYLKEYYHKEWDSGWDDHWNPETVARCIARNREEEYLKAEYPDRVQTVCQELSVDDIRDVLDRGYVAQICVDNYSGTVSCHAVLVYRYDEEWYYVYSPEYSGSSLIEYSAGELENYWIRTEGLNAYRRD